MQLEKQVCSLEQAKRLKELGVNAPCIFGYIKIPSNGLSVYSYWRNEEYALINADIVMFIGNGDNRWYAPTVAELGIMLPRNFASFNCGYDIWRIANTFNYASGHDKDNIGHCYAGTSKTYIDIHNDNEAAVRAAMLIYLLENNMTTAAGVNASLLAQ